jgi:hypothetical protein
MLLCLCIYTAVLEYHEAVVKPLMVKPLGDLAIFLRSANFPFPFVKVAQGQPVHDETTGAKVALSQVISRRTSAFTSKQTTPHSNYTRAPYPNLSLSAGGGIVPVGARVEQSASISSSCGPSPQASRGEKRNIVARLEFRFRARQAEIAHRGPEASPTN